MSANYKFCDGCGFCCLAVDWPPVVEYRCYAYLHKTNPKRYGILEAIDWQDARKHLGSQFWIKTIWLSGECVSETRWRKEDSLKIVKETFPDRLQLRAI